MKVWIDLSNSPHPLLFAPVARELEEGGHTVLVTVRDNAQTVELALKRWPRAEVIGGQSPRHRLAKAATIVDRIRVLRRWAQGSRPDVALSHNSYAQIVAARRLGIHAVTAMDFEYQPANPLAFRLATVVIAPEVVSDRALRRQGATAAKVVRYRGLKEELYIGDFEPDHTILASVGLVSRPRVVAVARTPPSRAVYHASTNPLFDSALRTICAQFGVVCVVLSRHPEQITAIERLRLENCVVTRTAVDARSLIYAADTVLGAGGTMTREAALMGVPTWTAFAGRTPAVDTWLERQGMLRRLRTADQLSGLQPRPAPPHRIEELRARGEAIRHVFVEATLLAATSGKRYAHSPTLA